MTTGGLIALMLAQAPGLTAVPQAVHQQVRLSICRAADAADCRVKALVVDNGDNGICIDAVMPSGRYAIGRTRRYGFMTRAALESAGVSQANVPAGVAESEPRDTILLITMGGAEPARVCVPLYIDVAGRRFRVVANDNAVRITTALTQFSGELLGVASTKGFRLARVPPRPEPYLLAGDAEAAADLSAVRMLGDYLFGTGVSALVSVTVTSDQPKMVLLDGIVRGRTNLSFQVARQALGRLMIKGATETVPLQSCRVLRKDGMSYMC